MMKRPTKADISNLFQKFGGDTGKYKEIQQEYVDEKAQQNWPIVAAMEKERVSAPMLKAVAENQRPRPAAPLSARSSTGSLTGTFAALAPNAPLASSSNTGAFPAFTQPAAAAPVAKETPKAPIGERSGAYSIFAKPAAPVAPAASSVQSLFGNLVTPASPAASNEPAPTAVPQRSSHDPLNTVFSRLSQPEQNVATPAADNSLRGMLGFLKK